MQTLTLYISNGNLELFNQAIATKGNLKTELGKAGIYTTTVTVSRKNGSPLTGIEIFELGNLFGQLTQSDLLSE